MPSVDLDGNITDGGPYASIFGSMGGPSLQDRVADSSGTP